MPAFITTGDVAYFQRINKEVYKLMMVPLQVYKVKADNIHNTYGEDPNKQFEKPYEMEAYIPDLPQWKNEMLKFGMDEVRNLIVYFSLDLLNESGFSKPDIGDQLVIQNDTYLITQTNPQQYGSNLQIPLSHIVECKRIRYERPDAGSVVQKEY